MVDITEILEGPSASVFRAEENKPCRKNWSVWFKDSDIYKRHDGLLAHRVYQKTSAPIFKFQRLPPPLSTLFQQAGHAFELCA
jgi:hypothetical protein